jgi:AraC-like DNA-binding protein
MDLLNKTRAVKHDSLTPQAPFELLHLWYKTAVPAFSEGDRHCALQFGIVLRGGFEYIFPGYRMIVKPGQVWWASSWEPHVGRCCEDDTDMVVMNVLMDSLGLKDPFGEFNWMLPFLIRAEHRPQAESEEQRKFVTGIGQELLHLWTERPFAWKTAMWLDIHKMILELCRPLREQESHREYFISGDYVRIIPAIQLVRNSGAGPVSLEQAAQECGFSRSRFSDVFRRAMGESFGRYELKSRLNSAAGELKNSMDSPKEIAERWGFFDSSHFYRVFKKYFGCTPTAFRENE